MLDHVVLDIVPNPFAILVEIFAGFDLCVCVYLCIQHLFFPMHFPGIEIILKITISISAKGCTNVSDLSGLVLEGLRIYNCLINAFFSKDFISFNLYKIKS